jgi:hypothetical protein
MSTERNQTRRQLGGELVIPVLAIGFTFYFFSSIWHSPWTAKVSAFSVGAILLLVCTIFIIRCIFWLQRGEATLGFNNLVTRTDISSGRIGLFLTTIGYCVLIDWLGFTLTTFLFLSTSMFILSRGRNAGFIAMISALMSLGGWAVFIWAFDTRFPRGWFETTMKAVLANG